MLNKKPVNEQPWKMQWIKTKKMQSDKEILKINI